ncbi:MAG: hypothetical protein MUC92_02570 [Fimbriimonadaceae bacterium]|jgi:hypothetical protein|nr:hypothetical protein [Fimbriimonadaceae bacterium]
MIPPPIFGKTFQCSGNDCLYRDHEGRRVVADIEGSGEFRVDCSNESQVTVFCDESLSHLLHGSFSQSLVVATTGQDPVVTTTGHPWEESGETKRDVHEGSGGVIAADGSPLFIDGDSRPLYWVPGQFPVPVWREVRGGVFDFVSAPFFEQGIDQWTIEDVSQEKDRAWKVQSLSQIVSLKSTFQDGSEWTAPCASHLNDASWNVTLPPHAIALRLEKLYDQFHGRQRVRVLLDGEAVGVWYQPEEDRLHRWGRSSYVQRLLPSFHPRTVRISLSPPAGVPLWSVAKMKVSVLLPKEKGHSPVYP